MTIEQPQLKLVIKEAIMEALRENSEFTKEVILEVLEDIKLVQRLEEGAQSELVDRSTIMELLETKP